MPFSRFSIFLCSFALLLISCSKEESSQVFLSGRLLNWGNAQKLLVSDAIEGDFGLATNQSIEIDEEGRFSLQFHLEKPTYYSLGRNKLYLQPGNVLYLEVDYRDPEKALFKGDGAELQTYLSGVTFPKSGSYLKGGRNVNSPDINKIMLLAEQNNEKRRNALNSLIAPDQFKSLEEMRLRLDQINTILSFPIYGSFKGYWESTEVQKAELLLPAKTVLNNLAVDLMQDEFMAHPNFRDMLYEFVDPHLQENGIFSNLSLTNFMKEYDAFGALVKQLELEGLTVQNQAYLNEYLGSDISNTYRSMALQKKAEYEQLLSGLPAIDLVFNDANGNERKLSEFKGQLIYVDLWATWCGPCIDELPALEELKETYADEPITFLPLSIDSDLDAWQKYLARTDRELSKEFIINRSALDPYKLITIPRYFLLDEDFKIITVFAPKPSEQATKALLDQELAKL